MAKTKKMDRLIAMDDMSGVADVFKKFETFLTVSRKFGYHCVYVSCNIAFYSNLVKNNFTNILNIFPASVPLNTVSKILQSN